MYFSSLVVGCVCVLCSTQRENLWCATSFLYILQEREKERKGGGWCLCVSGSVCSYKCGWIGRLNSDGRKKKRENGEEGWGGGGDLSRRKNQWFGGATPSCPVSHDECYPVEIYGCQSLPLGTALTSRNTLELQCSAHKTKAYSFFFFFFLFFLTLLMKSIWFPSSLIAFSLWRIQTAHFLSLKKIWGGGCFKYYTSVMKRKWK